MDLAGKFIVTFLVVVRYRSCAIQTNIDGLIGTEMARLAGGMTDVGFKNHDYETSVSFMKIAEVNGKAREEFVPFHYVTQTQLERDDILDYAMNEIRTKIDSN